MGEPVSFSSSFPPVLSSSPGGMDCSQLQVWGLMCFLLVICECVCLHMLRIAPEFLTRVFWAQTQGLVHRDAHAGLWNCIVAWWEHPPSPSGRALCFHIPCSSRHPKGCRWTWCCKSHPSVCALAAGAPHLLWGVSPWTHPPSLRTTRKDHSGIWMPSSVDAKKRDCLFMSCPSGPGNPTLPGFSRGGVGRRLGRNPRPSWSLPTGDGKSDLLTEELSSTPRTVMSAPSSLLGGLWVGCGPSSGLE